MRSFRPLALLLTLAVLLGGIAVFLVSCQLLSPTAPGSPESFPALEEVRELLQKSYVAPQVLKPVELERGAIRGMIEALNDPYTAYLDPQTHEMEASSLQGKFEGIGAFVAKQDKELLVIAPIPGSPAEQAGVRPGDRILGIDGQPTEKLNLQEAVLKIRGPQGTQVKLLIQHSGETETVELVITRAEITVTSVSQEMKGEMGYIRINHFTERTGAEFSQALSAVLGQGARGLVLDLRNNPGGLVSAVVAVAEPLLGAGVVLYEVDNQGNRKEWRAGGNGAATDLPIAVLVNGFSASGSEVLAGALQDLGRGVLIGTKTFGKGSVNTLFTLKDGSALYLTTARWLTPKERPIEGVGLIPDVVMEVTPQDMEGGKDPQLDRALEYLREQSGKQTRQP